MASVILLAVAAFSPLPRHSAASARCGRARCCADGDAELPLLELAPAASCFATGEPLFAAVLLPLVGVARAADAPPSAALAAATVLYAAGDAAASDAPLLAPTTLVNLGVLAASLYRAWAAAAAPAEAYDADSPNLRGADRLFDFDARLRERGRK